MQQLGFLLTLCNQPLNRRLRRFSPTCLGVVSSWTTHSVNHCAEISLIGVIGVIGGSNGVDSA